MPRFFLLLQSQISTCNTKFMQIINLKDIKNIVFDLGGVIITLDHARAIERFKAAGVSRAAEYLDPYHQNGIFLDLEAGRLTKEEFGEALRRETGKNIPDSAIAHGWLGFLKDVPPQKLAMLEDLRQRGFRLYLLSNTNPLVMEWALTSDFSPAGKPLDSYFDRMYLSYQMKCVKPDLEIFQKMIADSGMKPEETLFIDDGKNNVVAAAQLGFHTYQPRNGEDFADLFRF